MTRIVLSCSRSAVACLARAQGGRHITREARELRFIDAWPSRRVSTLDGATGTIVNRARGTVYLELATGEFKRYLVSEVEPLQPDEAVPASVRRRPRREPVPPRDG
jgi:hypothetical protein